MVDRKRNRNTDRKDTSVDERIAGIVSMIEPLDYPELKRLGEIIQAEYDKKALAARTQVVADARAIFDQLGLTFQDAAEMQTKRKRGTRTPAPPKYRSPDGEKTWNGRGAMPKWIRELEEAGHSRYEYLIKAE